MLLALFLALATIVKPSLPPTRDEPAQSLVTATPVPLDPDDPGRRRVGGLIFLRGWILESNEPRFGGISAMHVENGQIVALSDVGVLLRFGSPRRPGAHPLDIRPLGRRAEAGKLSRDSEALVVRGAHAWIAFERRNRVARLDRNWSEEAAERPAPMRSWGSNSGPEAMVRLTDGRFLVFAEGRSRGDPLSAVLLFDGDPAEAETAVAELRYRRPSGYRVTDAALLPDGRLLVLNRRTSWLGGFAAKLVIADVRSLRAGAIVEGREIAELRAPLAVDNMEALSVTREDGRTIVRIASDDNFMAIQRTLLLEFALEEAVRRPPLRPASSRSRASGDAP